MNYYERHIGDFSKDTMSLSQGQVGAYDLMLDYCYATEGPLPLDLEDVYNISRARTAQERRDTDKVLARYFLRTSTGYVQKRAQEEIERYQAKPSKKEGARERQARSRQRRAELFEQARKQGLNPDFDVTTAGLVTLMSRVTARDSHASVTPHVTAIQTPVPSPQEKDNSVEGSTHATTSSGCVCVRDEIVPSGLAEPKPGAPDPDPEHARRIALSRTLRDHGMLVQTGHPVIVAWERAGYTPERLRAAIAVARVTKPEPEPLGVKYLDPIIRNERNFEQAASTPARGPGRDWAAERQAQREAKQAAETKRAKADLVAMGLLEPEDDARA